MKKSKAIEQRIEKAIDEKFSLLKNIDRNDGLKIIPIAWWGVYRKSSNKNYKNRKG